MSTREPLASGGNTAISPGPEAELPSAVAEHELAPRHLTLGAVLAEGGRDLRRIRNHIVQNAIAGSPLLPKPVRWCIYRISGLKIHSVNVAESCVMHSAPLEIGKRVFVNRACYFEGRGKIVIGEDTQVGPECAFLTSHHNITMPHGRLVIGRPVFRDITIGARVWIGFRSTFLPGSSVEDDVVIAAGAVVSGHLSRGWIYGGVPARKIRPIQEASTDRGPES